jgi:hypothetical protein
MQAGIAPLEFGDEALDFFALAAEGPELEGFTFGLVGGAGGENDEAGY